jgi:hypothetical protein
MVCNKADASPRKSKSKYKYARTRTLSSTESADGRDDDLSEAEFSQQRWMVIRAVALLILVACVRVALVMDKSVESDADSSPEGLASLVQPLSPPLPLERTPPPPPPSAPAVAVPLPIQPSPSPPPPSPRTPTPPPPSAPRPRPPPPPTPSALRAAALDRRFREWRASDDLHAGGALPLAPTVHARYCTRTPLHARYCTHATAHVRYCIQVLSAQVLSDTDGAAPYLHCVLQACW